MGKSSGGSGRHGGAEAGAMAIYLTAGSEEALEETQNLVKIANLNTQCAYSVCDVTDARQVEAAVNDCVAQFGGIDVADANAGYLGPWVKIGESDPEGWWRNWEVKPQDQLQKFREWYEVFDSEEWDEQIASDASDGKLDDIRHHPKTATRPRRA